MYNEIITHYWKNPVNKIKPKSFDIRYWEENGLCGDAIEVFLKIDDDEISDFWFEWNTSIITTACASIFWESIIWTKVDEIFKLEYNYIKELIWEDVSPRRKNASVLWLLATRNALHKFLDDWKVDDFTDIID